MRGKNNHVFPLNQIYLSYLIDRFGIFLVLSINSYTVVLISLTKMWEPNLPWHTSAGDLWECVMCWSKHSGQCYHINANAISVYCYLGSERTQIQTNELIRASPRFWSILNVCLLVLVVTKLSHLCYCLEILSSSLFKEKGQNIPALFLPFSIHPELL